MKKASVIQQASKLHLIHVPSNIHDPSDVANDLSCHSVVHVTGFYYPSKTVQQPIYLP